MKIKFRWLLIAAILVALVVALVPDLAFARGGGGGHAGGGGGGGHIGGGGGGGGGIRVGGGGGGGGFPVGGGGGGFGGGGGSLFWLFPLLFWGGGGILVLFALFYVFTLFTSPSRGYRTAQSTDWEPAPTPALAPSHVDPGPGLAALEAADPAFDRTQFLDRVRRAFFTLQEAWMNRDLTPARPFMGQGLYLGWLMQVKQLVALHKINRMEDVAVTDIEFAAASHGRRFDHITARIDATAVDYEVDERTDKVVFGDRTQRPFIEYWTFERTAGTTTPEKGLLDQTCPNCGAPAEVNEVGECSYCRAAISTGRYDWVLTRIDQADQWETHVNEAGYGRQATGAVDEAAEAGVAAIKERDPGFDVDALLERFEMAYFLVQQALQEADMDPVKPYLGADLTGRWNAAVGELRAKGQHLLLENLNIQGVELEHAQVAAGDDVLVVRVVSVATRQILDQQGDRVAGDGVDQRLTERWTLSRPTGTQTPAAGGVLAHLCPNCGQPLAVDEVGHCLSCHAAITQGGLDWAITAVDPESWWTRPAVGIVRVM